MNSEERHTLIVPEKQSVITKLESTYEKMKQDPTSIKIKSLQAVEKALKAASTTVGIITVIDWVVPDPVLGIDEIALTGITALLGTATTMVNNKISQLETTGEADITKEEVQTLVTQITNVKNNLHLSKERTV